MERPPALKCSPLAERTPVVVDLEGTCWGPDSPDLRDRQSAITEVIEIGAVRLNPSPHRIRDTFQCFVRPERHPTLSKFCTELTGIEQSDVATAVPMAQALEKLGSWLGEESVVLCSWGPFERQILTRRYRELAKPYPFVAPHLDIRLELVAWCKARGIAGRGLSLVEGLACLQIPLESTRHRALADARMAARLLVALLDPEDLSPDARHVLALLKTRHPTPTHRGHLLVEQRNTPDGSPPVDIGKADWKRVCTELLTKGIVTDLGEGRGVRLCRSPLRRVEATDSEAQPASE